MQAFCSSITGALATQALLKGAGVGDDTATVLAATLTWLMKGEYISHAAVIPFSIITGRF